MQILKIDLFINFFSTQSPEVIKILSAEHEVYLAHKC